MKRHLATAESIAELKNQRKNVKPTVSKPIMGKGGLTKTELYKALKSLPRSGQKIPKKLIPKPPESLGE